MEIVADGEQLALPLLVGGCLIQVELKLLLDAAALWAAQKREDVTEPRVSLHDVAELIVAVEEEVVC